LSWLLQVLLLLLVLVESIQIVVSVKRIQTATGWKLALLHRLGHGSLSHFGNKRWVIAI